MQAVFQITLHEKDLELLKLIKAFFKGVGKIDRNGKDAYQYRVYSMKDLAVIIAHFDKYSLITQKQADYELFKQVFDFISRKEHLTLSGLQKLVAVRASMNKGLSDELKAAFPNITPVQRPLVKVPTDSINPYWLAGFASGEACFFVNVASNKSKARIWLRFQVNQHIRDEQLMRSLVEYLGCGHYYPQRYPDAGELIVEKFSGITDKIIPFFVKYPIRGVKALDFEDFQKVAEIMKVKGHLTESGSELIRIIKAGMNSKREVK